LATATTERMFAGKTPMQVTRVRITEAGRRALAEREGVSRSITEDAYVSALHRGSSLAQIT